MQKPQTKLKPSKLRFGLSKFERLQKPAQYREVYSSKQFGHSDAFSFNAIAHQTHNRLGVTVSKKVSKHAVERNRIKRVVKEFYRLHKHDLISSAVVINAKPKASQYNNQQLNNDLQTLWTKLLKWQRWAQRQPSLKTE